ncbi:MAG: Ig-like domain-containing protein [Acidobacteriota bacterium]|nr:Ig-like domain-containing protein [Acidobacteriota bacterium]
MKRFALLPILLLLSGCGAAALLNTASLNLKSIAVSPATASVSVGSTVTLKATGTYSNNSTKDITSQVTWSSGSTNVAAVGSPGVVTGKAVGTSTITAKAGTISGSATVTVTTSGPATLQSLTVTPGSAAVSVGGTQQYAATATYTDGSKKVITSSVTWSSSATGVATIASNGLASALTSGTTTITASMGAVSGSAVLSVANVNAATGCDGVHSCYIYAGAKGKGDGSSWANAYTGFGTGAGQVNPARMLRGVTYWIANGNYGAQNFTTPDNGTLNITIEGATPASHGDATDWNDAFAGVAIFGGGETGVFSDYWFFEGQTRGADWQSGYTIMFDLNGIANKSGVITNRDSSGNSYSHLTFDYVEVRGSNMNMTFNGGSSTDCSTYCDGGFYTGSPTNYLYVGHSWIHDVGDTQFQSNINSVKNSNGSHWIIEYNYISRDHTGDQSNGAHSEAFSSTVQDMVVRYNYFQDILSSGVITDASGPGAVVGPWYIYGNIAFWTDNANMYSAPGTTSSGLGDGFVGFFGGTVLGTSYIVNNTIANIGVQPHCSQPGVACQMFFLYASGSGSAKWIIENNLVWNAHGACVYDGGNTWTITADYNTVYGGTAGTMQNCGSNAQTVANTNPFVNWDGSGTQLVPYESLDFSLKSDTNTGNSAFANLPAGCTPSVNCMDTDMAGKQFGSNGVYERGAVQK